MSIPAFPRPSSKDGTDTFNPSPTSKAHVGMSMHEYFAAKAMQALLKDSSHPNVYQLAAEAYKVADAMVKARSGLD